jgi:hypothetical protein
MDSPPQVVPIQYMMQANILNIGTYECTNGMNWNMVAGLTPITTITPVTISSSPQSITITLTTPSTIPAPEPIASPEPLASPQTVASPAPEPEPITPVPFPATQKLSFMKTVSDLDNVPLAREKQKDQSYSIQVQHSDLNYLESNSCTVTVSVNGYIIYKLRNGSWINTMIQIQKWIVFSGSNDGKYITIASDAGSYVTSDSCSHWTKLEMECTSVGVDRSGQFQASVGNGIYLSSNFGASWSRIETPDDLFNQLSLSSDATQMLVSGELNSYLFSRGTFTVLDIPTGVVDSLDIQLVGSTYMYTISILGRGLYRSYDAVQWTLIKSNR